VVRRAGHLEEKDVAGRLKRAQASLVEYLLGASSLPILATLQLWEWSREGDNSGFVSVLTLEYKLGSQPCHVPEGEKIGTSGRSATWGGCQVRCLSNVCVHGPLLFMKNINKICGIELDLIRLCELCGG
jgi:hypothetical protein